MISSAKVRGLDAVMEHLDGHLGSQRRLKLPRALLHAVAGLTLALLLWAALAVVDRVVRTQGRIVPSDKPQLVQHLEGGIVSRVYVREGDVVAAGQPLVAVSDLMANSTRGEKQARLAGLQARAARLQAEADGASRFTTPSALASKSPEAKAEAEAFQARQLRLRQTTRVLEEQVLQRKQEARESEARLRGLSAELSVARQQLGLVQNMMARNAASQLELLDAQGRIERLATQIRESESAMPRLTAAAAELQERLGEVAAQFRSESRTALSDAQVELRRLEQDLRTDEDRVRRTVVTAPVAGTVNKLMANSVGAVVKSGETLLELTPRNSALLIETRAAPAERGPLRTGQVAKVRVSAFDYTLHGTIDATVQEISADSLVDERGERYFRVALAVDAASAAAFGHPLTPGMTVAADVVIGERTVLQYLISPVRGLASTALRERQ